MATIKQIAERCGVSVSTVSKALNGAEALLDLWFANYDNSVKPQGITNARRNYYKRLDRSIQEIRAADTFKVMHPDSETTTTPTLGLMMNWAMLYSAHTNGSW